jgi:ADP-ribose pyrophosphatase YjhB (NUDIX family)
MLTETQELMVACGAICEKAGKILMVEEIRPEEGRVLNQPVGKLEFGEDVFAATIRETKEETGLDIELTHFLGVYIWLINNGNTSIRFCFIGCVVGGQLRDELRTDNETVSPVWLSREELDNRKTQCRNCVTKQCLDDYFLGKLYPLEIVQTLKGPPYFGY